MNTKGFKWETLPARTIEEPEITFIDVPHGTVEDKKESFVN